VGQYVFNNRLTIVMTGVSDAQNGSSPVRMLTNSSTLTFPTAAGAPPSISPIPNITVMAGQPSTYAYFVVSDPEDGVPTAAPTVVSSSNPDVVPPANVQFGGSGANSYVFVNPAGTEGTSAVTIQILDSAKNPAQRTFTVTVQPLNYAPVISTPPPTNTQAGTFVTIPFTVGDAETIATNLTVSGYITNYSGGILATLSFTSDASGTNRTVTVTPVAGTNGVGVVALIVSDGAKISTTAFPIMVLPAPNVVFSDHFDYGTGASVLTNSAGAVAPFELQLANVATQDGERPRLP